MEKYMKISDILTEEFDSCVIDNLDSMFKHEYEEISYVFDMEFDELLDVINKTSSTKEELNLDNEKQKIEMLQDVELDEPLYIPTKIKEQLVDLEGAITDGGTTMQISQAVQSLVRLLSKNATTHTEWENSEDFDSALQQAESECKQSSDPYVQSGMREKDF